MKRYRIGAIIIIFLMILLSIFAWRSCSTGGGSLIPTARPNEAQCQESMATAHLPKIDYGYSGSQGDHWTAKGLIGCSTVTISYGSMTEHIVCLKTELPVVNGVVDGYVKFDYKSCPLYQEANIGIN